MTAGQNNPVAAGQWMMNAQGQQQGPFTLDQMKQMVREGQMPPDALVWMPGMAEWKPWRQTPEFALPAGGGGWTDTLRQHSKGPIGDYLVFRRMILPIMIQALFWLGVAALGLLWLNLVWMLSGGVGTAILYFLGIGFLTLVLALLWRCMCEAMILFYRINETLTDVKNAIEKQGSERRAS